MGKSIVWSSIINLAFCQALNKDEIEKLDQAIGDGDHIFNIQRGLNEALKLEHELSNLSPEEVFKKIGMKIMTTVGGSSGALFATLLMGMSKKYSKESNDLENLAAMFYEGVEATKKRGKADIGEKTMLDVLIPVSLSLNKLKNEKNIKTVAEKIKMVAEEGMLSTKDIMATKGRASFLGERAIGHIDPGARSSQLAINAICDEYIK